MPREGIITMYAAVVFDVYGTLYDTDSLTGACESVFPGKGQVISQTWRQKQLQYSWLRTLMNRYVSFETVTTDALRFTLSSLRLPHDRSLLKGLTDHYHTLDLFPDVTKTLDKLKPIRLAILSNGSSTMLRKLLFNSRLRSRFEQVISAESTWSYKPRVAVYRLGQTVLRVPRRQTLFVSANAWDIAGAKTFGFVTVWVNRKAQRFDELGSRYDYEVSSLRQLPRIVGI